MPKQQRGIKVICEEGEKSFPSNLEFSYTNTVHEKTYQGVESNFANTDPTCSFYHHFYFGKFHGTAYYFQVAEECKKAYAEQSKFMTFSIQ